LKCVFIDRDGTLIRHRPYLADPAQVELLPTVVDGLNEFVSAGCELYLHSNQSGIGRGYFSQSDALACNDEMLRQIGLGPQLFAGVCICPESPEQIANYRKPSPKYALEIISKYGITRDDVCYLGDNVSDMLTARNLGCLGVALSTGVHSLQSMLRQSGFADDFPIFDNFMDAAKHVLTHFRYAHAAR